MLLWTILAALRSVVLYSWLFVRPVLGWFFIVIGLIGMPMPIVNGLIFLVIGLSLVGHRNRIIRWSRVHIKLLLHWWATRPHPILSFTGRLARRSAQEISRQHRRMRWWWMERQARKQAERQARKQVQRESPKLIRDV